MRATANADTRTRPDAETPHRAVFLDRDGVINRPLIRHGKPYPPASLDEFDILPGVPDACRLLKKLDFLLVVATNQPDVGRGTLPRDAVETIHRWLSKQLPIDAVFTCFHAGEAHGQTCDCRKPRPGMLLQAVSELRIDLANSFMIGDRWRDVECALNAGCKAIFIDWGYQETLKWQPPYRVGNLLEAAKLIETLTLESHART
jgi:D-glycero-D-manno-heptose 1,7-bisphosphate phosphatase